MANRWGHNGNSDRLFEGAPKSLQMVTAAMKLKRRLLLEWKVMTNLDSILKSRDITLPTKLCLVKAMVFLVAMYGWESWTIKKAEHQRTDAFVLWCWRRLLKNWCWSWNSNISATWCEELIHLKRPWCWCYSHAFRETNSLRRTMQIMECSLLHRQAQGRVSS